MTDTVHGVSVPDPYRWLEDGQAPETREWVARQNERTRRALDARPDRGRWHERLVALMGLPVVLDAAVRDDRLFVLERASGAEQFALALRSAGDSAAEPRVLIDPAGAATDSATAIDWYHPSADGALVAYGISEGGDEDSTLRILDVVGGSVLADTIENTRAASVAWLPDGSGFYYTVYPPGDEYNRHVRFHRLGTPVADDPVVWSDPSNPVGWPEVQIAPDGRFLLVSVEVTFARTDAFLLDRSTGTWTTVVSGPESQSSFEFDGEQLLISTTVDAPRGRVVTAPLSAPQSDNWTTVVPESDAILGRAKRFGEDILVLTTERAVDRIDRWTPGGATPQPLADLGLVSIASFTVSADRRRAFVTVAGFDAPARLCRFTDDDGLQTWVPISADASTVSPSPIPAMTVSQLRYPSLDGTEIGMFLIHRADVVPGPDTPAILNGYGGFAISETPLWSPLIAAWCERGGVYAIAGLRGGLEEGEAWHDAGRRANKQNVFDDFHAAADWLVSTGRASRDRLAIHGGSNGGLLVGVALTQRPDLCRAVWCAVPLLDMIRFPEFLIARLWTDEYGDPAVEEEFHWLWAYSPYHHVSPGTRYPAVLLRTAEGDTRVDPLHARKMAALLQAEGAGQDERPVLFFQEGRAGHGVGKPASKRADEIADGLAFLSWQLSGT